MPGGARQGPGARLAALVEPVVVAAGCDLEDVRVTRAGRRSVVQVVVDADGGVGLDHIAELSRAISARLDNAEGEDSVVGRQSYTLEVTSPGVDRPLVQPRHWRRAVGRLVAVRIDAPAEARNVTARVAVVTDGGVVFDPPGPVGEVPYHQLGAGRVRIEFDRSPGTGHGGPTRAGPAGVRSSGRARPGAGDE